MYPNLYVAGIDSVRRLGLFEEHDVAPDYFAVMGTRLLRGRPITGADLAGAPRVMVVSDAMARALWPGKDALGQCVRVGADTVPCTYVVGVTEGVLLHSRLGEDAGLYFWRPASQADVPPATVLLRMTGVRPVDREGVRRKLQAIMPGSSYIAVSALDDLAQGETRAWRLGATMFTLFGALALALAAIGLYSVISYSVAQRTHELGVRVALGAQMHDLVRLVLGEGMRLAASGVVLGGLIAFATSRWMAPLLFHESPHDPWVYGGVALVLVAVAALASFLPARRAGTVDPLVALRSE
jgi:hypothetical protein